LVSGFGSGAYSEKLLAGTRHRFSGFDQPRQCGDDVLRMLVTGGPPNLGGGGITPAHHRLLAVGADVTHYRRRIVGEHAGHRRQVADVAVHDAKQRDDGAWLVVME
jgi:hypothetical protein